MNPQLTRCKETGIAVLQSQENGFCQHPAYTWELILPKTPLTHTLISVLGKMDLSYPNPLKLLT